jgi:hypothetical protein
VQKGNQTVSTPDALRIIHPQLLAVAKLPGAVELAGGRLLYTWSGIG